MSGHLDALLSTLGPFAVILVLGVVFAETGLLFGFFLPGDSLLFTAGLLVAHGDLGVPIWVIVPAVTTAAAAGDQVGYLVGRRYGPRVLSRPQSRLLDPRHLENATMFFARHGPRAVILARFVPLARTFTPVAAGAARMRRGHFTTYNVLGATLWCASMLGAGYLFGGIGPVRHHIELITVGIIVLSLTPAGLALLRRRTWLRPWALASGAAASAALVLGLADAAGEHDGPAASDPRVAAAVVAHRDATLTPVARALSFLGGEVVVAILAGVLIVFLWTTQHRRSALILTTAMTGAAALTIGIKQLVSRHRPGPHIVLGPVDHGYSFPSGHTLMTATLVVAVVWLAWPRMTRVSQIGAAAFAALVVAAVGASRVYLGYHWTTDIIAACLIAAGWLALLALATELVSARPLELGTGPTSGVQDRSRLPYSRAPEDQKATTPPDQSQALSLTRVDDLLRQR
ncbi:MULTISPECIES: VTT domain-containing protein [unclassified Nocardioides]|uniref:bifunctional DedA family/phosphatase PAP2 family protein n=1 Tax=unclassified Nocardioides TaxID=2615069 RepID=UPI000056FC1F|nr:MULTISPECIES: VTT domain-containing protein [unclassified Nocardioides]ABL81109.1 phosphoesterase, PA-phosphatase related protein [Nocardioides sp. JS614]